MLKKLNGAWVHFEPGHEVVAELQEAHEFDLRSAATMAAYGSAEELERTEVQLQAAADEIEWWSAHQDHFRMSWALPKRGHYRVLGPVVPTQVEEWQAGQETFPQLLREFDAGADRDVDDAAWRLFWFRNLLYRADEDLSPDDVFALINEQDNRKRLKLQKAHALQAMVAQGTGRRQAIPRDVKVLVWQRDGGKCVECDSKETLEYDHVIPLAMGGSNSDRNLQLLCEDCNRRKGATLG